MQDLGDLFSGESADKVVFAAGRLKILPFLFFNVRYHHSLQLRDDFSNLDGDSEGLLEHYRFYEPGHGFIADVELGWEF
jgi:hypothetical protein